MDISCLFLDTCIIVAGWIIGNAVFNNFEKHLSWVRRFTKLICIVLVLLGIEIFAGRVAMYSTVGVMMLGMTALHGYWFPKHGINGRTAEPYDKYLALVKKTRKKN